MSEHGIGGAGTRLEGHVPQELVLSDGSRLVLGSATGRGRGRAGGGVPTGPPRRSRSSARESLRGPSSAST